MDDESFVLKINNLYFFAIYLQKQANLFLDNTLLYS